jgi:hypothetical protein
LVYKGRSEAGSIIEVRSERSGGLAVEVDGAVVQRLDAEQVPIARRRPAVFRLDGVELRETFDADPDALRALNDFLSSGGTPPWQHTAALLADGLIDVNFSLTPRGRRAPHR